MQMSRFQAKVHRIPFQLGLRSRFRWGSLQRFSTPLAGCRRHTSI